MPWVWLSGSPTTSSSTSGSAATTLYICDAASPAQAAYQAITHPHWHGQTAASAAANVYSTGTISPSTVVWVDTQGLRYIRNTWVGTGTNTVIWEDCVDQAQYMALAQQRVVRTEEVEREWAQRQEERAREIAEHQRQMAEITARNRAFEIQSTLERDAALARSRELLLSHLTPKQRKTFEENHWFIVKGGITQTRYRIRTTSHTHNIEILRGDVATSRLCGHLRGSLPLHDHHVAQKISLEYDEEAFVRLCNRSAA